MTPFEKQQIRTLVWKEWRQVRAVIGMGMGIIILFLLMPVWSPMKLGDAIYMGTVMALLLLSFGLGVVPYGMELNDHTNAYLITRPVEHWKVFVVKLLWSLFPVWILAFLMVLCFLISGQQIHISLWRMVFAPMVFLSVQFFILLIQPMVPSLILSISAGLLSIWCVRTTPWPLLVVLCGLFVVGSYMLAGNRMRRPGW